MNGGQKRMKREKKTEEVILWNSLQLVRHDLLGMAALFATGTSKAKGASS
jgi:hypothetical protein